jgi:hypothetical protein
LRLDPLLQVVDLRAGPIARLLCAGTGCAGSGVFRRPQVFFHLFRVCP